MADRKIGLQDLQNWRLGVADDETVRIIEAQLADPASAVSGALRWLRRDWSVHEESPEQEEARDQIRPDVGVLEVSCGRESSPSEDLPDAESEVAETADPYEERGYVEGEDGTIFKTNSMGECFPMVFEGLQNFDAYMPVFPFNRTIEYNSYSKLTTKEELAAWGNDSLGA